MIVFSRENSPKRSKLVSVFLGLLVFNLLLWSLADSVVTIGFSLPLTGGAAKEGTESRVGAELAAQYINDAGGFDVAGENVTINVIFEDDLCTPGGAIDAANRLAVAGATYVGGSFCSSSALAQMPVFAALGIPQVAFAYADELTTTAREEAGADLAVRLGVQASNEMVPLAKYAVLENGDQTFFLMAQNTDFGRSMVKHFRNTVEALGGSLVAEPEYFAYAETDYRTLLTKAKNSGADAIAAIGLAQEMIGILLQKEELDVPQTIYGSDLVSDVSVVGAVGDAVLGVYFPWYDDDGTAARTFDRTEVADGVRTFVAAGEESLGVAPGRNHGLGWGTVMLIKQAMERAGSTDPAVAMQEVLSGDDFSLSYGDYYFLQCGQAFLGAGVATFTEADGLLYVADRDYAFTDPAMLSETQLCQ